MCLHVAASTIPFNDMQHDHVLKKFNFDPVPGGSVGKIFATMLLHAPFQ